MMTMSQKVASILCILLLWPLSASAQYTIAPEPYQTVHDNNGLIVSGACVWTYAAGTTTQATTYATESGTPNTFPIVADSAGRFVAFLSPGLMYKFVYENTPCSVSPPVHGPVLKTVDGISAVPASLGTQRVSGLDVVVGLLDITNSTTETALYSFTVLGGTLATDRVLRLTVTGFLSTTTNTDTLTLKVKWGGSSMALAVDSFTAPTSGPYELVTYIVTQGSPASQWVYTKWTRPTAGTTVGGPTDLTNTTPLVKATSQVTAVDSTVNQIVTVTGQWSGTFTTDHFQRYHVMLELIQ